jgi:hypothetical protein
MLFVTALMHVFRDVGTDAVHSRDPAFVTPYIKLLLRKRNRLLLMGHFEHAKAISDNVQGT